MSEKVQAQWFDKLYATDPQLWLAVDAMLLLMLKSGLPMPTERAKQFDIEDPETIGVYVHDVRQAGITVADVKLDGHHVRKMLRWFPSSTDLVTALLALKHKREPKGVIYDPVYIAEGKRVFVTSREKALASNLRHFETQLECERANGLTPPAARALPGRNVSEKIDALAKKLTTTKLPSNFPARSKLAKAGITTVEDVLQQELPSTLTADERRQAKAIVNGYAVMAGPMSNEKRAEIMAEIQQLAERDQAKQLATG